MMTSNDKNIVYGYLNNDIADNYLIPGFNICYKCLHKECTYYITNTTFFLGIGNGMFNKRTLEEYNRFSCPVCEYPLGITGIIYTSCSFEWGAFTGDSEFVYESVNLYFGEFCSVPFIDLNINLETWNTTVSTIYSADVGRIITDNDLIFLGTGEKLQ